MYVNIVKKLHFEAIIEENPVESIYRDWCGKSRLEVKGDVSQYRVKNQRYKPQELLNGLTGYVL